ncbi:transposable element Tcb1 transposase [Trichonephila clavipes]|nr:transposable element Tcb1 transposase [Trichonephila clavipes]
MVALRLTQITPPAATPDQLWQRVEAAWSVVLQEHIQSLYETMTRRVAAVISNNGGYSVHKSGAHQPARVRKKFHTPLRAMTVVMQSQKPSGHGLELVVGVVELRVRNSVPLKPRGIQMLMHVKPVEALSHYVGVVLKFGGECASLGVFLVT